MQFAAFAPLISPLAFPKGLCLRVGLLSVFCISCSKPLYLMLVLTSVSTLL
tara:strand:- start:1198 stop:1350 length:153 start_codon:yes stop_codon:yes gene_type:complete